MSASSASDCLACCGHAHFASASHRRAAASLLDRAKIPDGYTSMQRTLEEEDEPAAFVGKQRLRLPGLMQARTLCIRLAPKSSRKLARRLVHRALAAPVQGTLEESIDSLCRQAAPPSAWPDRHANFAPLHLPRTEEQPQACSIIRRRFLTDGAQRELETIKPAAFVGKQRLRLTGLLWARTLCIRLAPTSSRTLAQRLVQRSLTDGSGPCTAL